MLLGLLPAWVQADPLRSRAVDALGLQATADQLADRFLPGLSVLTTRARYFSFLCWARQAVGDRNDDRKIHRLEVSLLLAEAQLSEADPSHAESCRFVGSRNVKTLALDRIPADPRVAYKTPVWRAYRASMLALGLLEGGRAFRLTETGSRAAKYFKQAARPRNGGRVSLPTAACLSRISVEEQRLLRDVLGLSLRGQLDPESIDPRVRRARFAREVRRVYRHTGLAPETILPRYAGKLAAGLAETQRTLRAAAVWEYLALGLNLVFVLWARSIEQRREPRFIRELRRALASRAVLPELKEVKVSDPLDEGTLRRAHALLAYACRLRDRLGERRVDLPGVDMSVFAFADELLAARDRQNTWLEETLHKFLVRHLAAKGDDAWITETGNGRLEIARDPDERWQLPDRVAPHAYRFEAFDSIARDLGGL